MERRHYCPVCKFVKRFAATLTKDEFRCMHCSSIITFKLIKDGTEENKARDFFKAINVATSILDARCYKNDQRFLYLTRDMNAIDLLCLLVELEVIDIKKLDRLIKPSTGVNEIDEEEEDDWVETSSSYTPPKKRKEA